MAASTSTTTTSSTTALHHCAGLDSGLAYLREFDAALARVIDAAVPVLADYVTPRR